MGSDREEIFKKRKGKRKERKENNRELAPYRYLIVCEGEKTEPNYFMGLRDKINSKYKQSIRVEQQIEIDIQGTGRNTNDLVRYVEELINRSPVYYGNVWVVFDKDDFTDNQFNSAIEQAKSKGYKVAWSNEAIELWFILHFEFLQSAINRDEYIKKLSQKFRDLGYGKYEKNIKNIFDILTECGSIDKAIDRAKKLLKMHGDVPASKMKPATTVYQLVEELLQYIKD